MYKKIHFIAWSPASYHTRQEHDAKRLGACMAIAEISRLHEIVSSTMIYLRTLFALSKLCTAFKMIRIIIILEVVAALVASLPVMLIPTSGGSMSQ